MGTAFSLIRLLPSSLKVVISYQRSLRCSRWQICQSGELDPTFSCMTFLTQRHTNPHEREQDVLRKSRAGLC